MKRITVPWAREGSSFTLLFEQVALSLVREMPVKAAARQMGIADKRLWRIVEHYVGWTLADLGLSEVTAVAPDEAAAKRGQHYVTVFIDFQRAENPVIFATSGRGTGCLSRFQTFLTQHEGDTNAIWEMVCDMAEPFQTGVTETFPNASLTSDWFHVVQRVTEALNDVRKGEAWAIKLPEGARWATLKASDRQRTDKQEQALAELMARGAPQARPTPSRKSRAGCGNPPSRMAPDPLSGPGQGPCRRRGSLGAHAQGPGNHRAPVRIHHPALASTYSNARLKGLNSIFQATRARARGNRTKRTFITMIYLLAAPIGKVPNST